MSTEPTQPTQPAQPTLVEFLLARIDEREAAARAALEIDQKVFGSKDGYVIDYLWARMVTYLGGVRGHTFADGAPTPAQVLADCESKRRIVREVEELRTREDGGGDILELLALPYADHPDYRQEWAL